MTSITRSPRRRLGVPGLRGRLARLRAELRAVEPGPALPRLSAYPVRRDASPRA